MDSGDIYGNVVIAVVERLMELPVVIVDGMGWGVCRLEGEGEGEGEGNGGLTGGVRQRSGPGHVQVRWRCMDRGRT